jgi:hypothetical protein
VRSTAAPYTESRLTRSVANERVGFPVVEQRDSATRFFAPGFFHESVSPQPQSIPFRPFQIFSKIHGDIRESRCTTGINNTGGKFATVVNDTGGNITAGINDTSGKFATGIGDTSGK